MKRFQRLIAILLFLSACTDPFEEETFTAYEELPIGLLLKENAGEYSLWVELMEHAGLYNTFNLQTVYTCFVPNNDAVSRYLEENDYASVADIPVEDADYLVKYHTIYGTAFDLGQFQSGAINELNETDDNLSVEFREGGLDSVYLNGKARFLQFNIKATNGIIHVLEDVLVPLRATILDRLEEERFSIFHEAVTAAGFDEMLNTIYTESTDPLGNPIEIRYRYTAFAVSDETFAAAGINSIDDLKNELEVAGGDYTSPGNKLYQYVAYHLLNQLWSYTDLAEFPEGKTTMNVNTLAANQLLSVSDVAGELIINYDEERGSAIRVTERNIACKNGAVHEVDNWMPLFTPPQVTFIWELTDYPDLEANVSQFQNPDLGSQYNKTFTEGELTSYRWRARPETRTGVLAYRNNRAADGIWYSDVLNYDHLRVTVGESGWIEMDSPVIVEGTYEVTFVWPSPKHSDRTGNCAFVLDGQMMRSFHTISNKRRDRVLEQSLGEITFDKTESHTLRVISIDGKLITMDYIRFDPVD